MGAISFSLDQDFVDFSKKVLEVDTFVETGTFRGDTVQAVSSKFKNIHSVEVSKDLFEQCKNRFKNSPHIHIHLGDSGPIVRKIVDEEVLTKNRVLYWLDAHWCEATSTGGLEAQCPLLSEIAAIQSLNENSIILIDDARLFLAPPNGHDSYSTRDWPKFQQVVKALTSLSANHEISVCNDVIFFSPIRIQSQLIDFLAVKGADWLTIADKSRDYDTVLSESKEKEVVVQRLSSQMQQLSDRMSADLVQLQLRILDLLRRHDFEIHKSYSLKRVIFRLLNQKLIKRFRKQVALPIPVNPLLSIVVPTFNQGPFIRDCLNSIRNQSYKNIEVIIQDSLSTDETKSICLEFTELDPRFKYFPEKDSGQTDAINRGLFRSSGLLWTWLCSDDRFHSVSSMENLVQGFIEKRKQNPKVVGVFGSAFYMTESGEILSKYRTTQRNLFLNDFKENWPLSQPASILMRENVYEVGGPDPVLHLGMDLDLFIRVLKDGNCFSFVDVDVADVRLQDNSKSVKFRKDTALNALIIIRKYFGSVGRLAKSAYVTELGLSVDHETFKKHMKDLGKGSVSLKIYFFKNRLKALLVRQKMRLKHVPVVLRNPVNFCKRALRFVWRRSRGFAAALFRNN